MLSLSDERAVVTDRPSPPRTFIESTKIGQSTERVLTSDLEAARADVGPTWLVTGSKTKGGTCCRPTVSPVRLALRSYSENEAMVITITRRGRRQTSFLLIDLDNSAVNASLGSFGRLDPAPIVPVMESIDMSWIEQKGQMNRREVTVIVNSIAKHPSFGVWDWPGTRGVLCRKTNATCSSYLASSHSSLQSEHRVRTMIFDVFVVRSLRRWW